jgi:hypothetical protein
VPRIGNLASYTEDPYHRCSEYKQVVLLVHGIAIFLGGVGVVGCILLRYDNM